MAHIKTGLRIHGKNGHPKVREALIRFAKWLRKIKEFPVRVNVYLSQREYLVALDGDQCFGTIWIPDDPEYYPSIRLATGDYEMREQKFGRDNALAKDLNTLSHELVHYWQWIETGDMWEKGVPRQATTLVNLYSKSTAHP